MTKLLSVARGARAASSMWMEKGVAAQWQSRRGLAAPAGAGGGREQCRAVDGEGGGLN